MTEFELIMPKMGESIAEATIIRWLKNEGDKIEVDESVLEIATDKVDSEVPAPKGGILTKKLYKDGDVVAVGKAVAIISTEAAAPSSNGEQKKAETRQEEKREPVMESSSRQMVAEPAKAQAQAATNSGEGRFYSPLVLNIARSEGIGMAELENIPGSGGEGRVTKKDVIGYLNNRGSSQGGQQPAQQQTQQQTQQQPSAQSAPVKQGAVKEETHKAAPAQRTESGDEIIEMDRMRKLIADHMVMSKHTSPHVTSFVEADVTNLVMWREKAKDRFLKREGEKITFTPLFIEAVVKAIKDYPLINVSVDGNRIIRKKSINIGMAAALPSGNLIVPVIKNADQMNLIGLTRSVNDLADRSRKNKLQPDDIQGGTFTITNVGGFGNLMGTPIINQPQVAILATGTIKKKPAVLETEHGDVIAIRHMMFLSLSYDHRVVDGSLGGSFLRKVADYLEQFDIKREF
jgi:2-oxoglutarate dehydrogenase E2 component (dihydrolipoamide succinyltransferase)